MRTKKCSHCKSDKPISEFYFHWKRCVWTSKCKECRNLSSERWRNSHKEEIQIRRYNLTNKEYLNLFNQQEGKCAICNTPQIELKRKLVIDHDHETGKIRGLLCMKCNHGLGQFNDNPLIIKKALKYLL